MKTTPVTPADLSASVLAVPPLARRADFSLAPGANRALIAHLESGGVRTLMYGGNANFYHMPLSEYAATLDFLAEAAGAGTWVIPSAGADYGKLMDQAAILRGRGFPTVMALPFGHPSNDSGVATALRRFADRLGTPVIAYVKSLGYIEPATLGKLVADGVVCAIKYAVVRDDPAKDAYLDELVRHVDRGIVISGIGERPAIVHLRDFGLKSFTSGSVCVAPRGSMRLLTLLEAKRYEEAAKIREAYIALEDQRDAKGPIRVLHDAVTLAGIADMGPMLPMISNLEAAECESVKGAAVALLAHDRALSREALAA
ncbi:MAG TPA: dihydrodipicolinate synthase family protein [Usitatibacter sp.]|jgi:dihydrodipicolinate synthase/N-acetylneuraminate lyase|nr:dihydrodipicolinate synthase family protein [Usitatibacter sp.]